MEGWAQMAPKLVYDHEGIVINVYEQTIMVGNNTLWLKRPVKKSDVDFVKAIFDLGMQTRSAQITQVEAVLDRLKGGRYSSPPPQYLRKHDGSL